MEKIINPTTARTNLFSLIKNANRDSQPVIIAGSNDSRSAVLIGKKDYDALQETMNLMMNGQIQAENDTKSLISSFLHLIGLGQLSKQVNFKRHSAISFTMIIAWLFEARFSRRSLYRAQASPDFSPRTARNVLNDGRIN